MGLLAWVMMGLAVWHFTIFLPDRFWGGIVGAFVGALVGSAIFGYVTSGFSVPGNDDITIVNALQGIPGAVIGMAIVYYEGIRRSNAAGEPVHGA